MTIPFVNHHISPGSDAMSTLSSMVDDNRSQRITIIGDTLHAIAIMARYASGDIQREAMAWW